MGLVFCVCCESTLIAPAAVLFESSLATANFGHVLADFKCLASEALRADLRSIEVFGISLFLLPCHQIERNELAVAYTNTIYPTNHEVYK